MDMTRFVKEIFNGLMLGAIIFFAFKGYYFITGSVGETLTWKDFYSHLFFSTLLYLANMTWFLVLQKKWENNLFTLKRLAIAIAGNVLVSALGVIVARIFVLLVFYKRTIDQALGTQTLEQLIRPTFIALVVSIIFYAVYHYRYRQENRVKEQKIIAGTASAKFDALKNQLDPHFLFNSLNVLTSLIEEDPVQAQKFTTSLSKVYRYVLEQKNKDLVSVDEELAFAKTYVRLLKMRFENSIVFDIPDRCSNPDAKIVPLSLQLLLENAVKHNVVTSERPLKLTVAENGDMLTVTNNVQEKQVVHKSSGVGLQNIQQRYALLTARKVDIRQNAGNFTVQLPMLSQNIPLQETQKALVDEKLYKMAKERVAKLKGFYGNLLSYLIVIPALAILNYRTTDFPWVLFPILGWGIGLAAHGMEAFGYNPLLGKKWEERRIKKYMDDENF